MLRKNRKYWALGILGAVCFGIGDWLLGYVDPGTVSESFSVIKAGHGAEYDLFKITMTLLLGAMGMPWMMLGCVKTADLVTSEKSKNALRFWMALLPAGWMIIHFTVSVSIYVYSWEARNGAAQVAQKLAVDILHAMQPAQIVSCFLACVPLMLLPIYALRGKTILQKRSQLFTPLLWMALLSGLKFLVPATPFSNGIDTFCMNAGMIVWFAYLMVAKEGDTP